MCISSHSMQKKKKNILRWWIDRIWKEMYFKLLLLWETRHFFKSGSMHSTTFKPVCSINVLGIIEILIVNRYMTFPRVGVWGYKQPVHSNRASATNQRDCQWTDEFVGLTETWAGGTYRFPVMPKQPSQREVPTQWRLPNAVPSPVHPAPPETTCSWNSSVCHLWDQVKGLESQVKVWLHLCLSLFPWGKSDQPDSVSMATLNWRGYHPTTPSAQ